mgnify:CR=1 FL=1|jgi:phage protein|nr:MAG TPA: Putative modification methylase [Caudoviricetes sp.]
MQIIELNINDINQYENNTKIHTDEQIEQIVKSIQRYGNNDPIAIDENNTIIEGHGRYLALKRLGVKEVPVIKLEHLSEEQKREYILVHNKLTMNTGFDLDKLQSELESIEFDMSQFDFDIFKDEKWSDQFDEEYRDKDGNVNTLEKLKNSPSGTKLKDRFVIPPFSVLNTESGDWQTRKRSWLELGIKSEVGREENLVFSKSLQTPTLNGTSVFDPVLCEVSYRWFSPTNVGEVKILDCFAGGSVRGVVAERLGHNYTGVDLREEQVQSNYKNAEEIGCDMSKLNWITGDSKNIDTLVDGKFDLVFTCPPYFDLEVYSDDENDISNMEYEDFEEVYKEILVKTVDKLKNNRFAIVVISDVRDKKGFYRDLVGLTKEAMKESGALFYNDIILKNANASGAIRANGMMKNRKVVRLHQNVLVFFKGDPKKIKEDFEPLEEIGDFFE